MIQSALSPHLRSASQTKEHGDNELEVKGKIKHKKSYSGFNTARAKNVDLVSYEDEELIQESVNEGGIDNSVFFKILSME